MQASKPISKPGTNKAQQSAKQQEIKDQSVVQRVLNITTTQPLNSGKDFKGQPSGILQTQTSSNNSVENDHEVESITNRVELNSNNNSSAVNSNTSSNSNLNSEFVQLKVQQQQQLADTEGEAHLKSSCSSLILVDSVFGGNLTAAITSKPLEPASIGLDTKVPLAQHKQANNNFQPINFQEDEVSYYNETPAMAPQADQKVHHSGSSSLEKCAVRPPVKLVLAASMANQQTELYQNELASNNKENREPNNRQQQPSAFVEHNYMTADYNNLSDVHYDNAPLIETGDNQRHLPDLSASSYPRYQEISSPIPALTSNSSPIQNNCFAQNRTSVSISTSPKAKSAPATPCNVIPIAFHQNSSHIMLNPNLANTLPPDIRKNISATCRVLPSLHQVDGGRQGEQATCQQQQHLHQTANGAMQPVNSKHLDNLIKRGELELADKNYASAIETLSKCINLATESHNDSYVKKNFRMYSLRAEAHFELGNYHEAIDDSMAARGLSSKLTQAYYLQGRAQFMIGQYADALAVFSYGLTQAPNNEQLFEALVDAALKSSFGREFQHKFAKLKAAQLDRRPFVVVAVLGQELLAKGHNEHAAIILESALKLSSSTCTGNNNINGLDGGNQKKFHCSVLSTISMAYFSLRDYEKAIHYMDKELEIGKELEDISEQCRVLNNLGYTYFKVRKFDKSLEAHRKQLYLAMKNRSYPQASQALNAIGHVHTAKEDYSNALTSHTRCLDILKQLDNDCYAQFKELLAIGHVNLMLNDLKAADERFDEANQLLKQKHTLKIVNHEEFNTGSIMIQFNLAHVALRRQSFQRALQHYQTVIELTRSCIASNNFGSTMKRVTYEMRACNGLGQAYRLLKKFDEARKWFEEQLKLAKILKNQVGQSRALCNLGMIYQHFEDHHKARQLFEENLKLVDNNALLKAYAHSYLGSAYQLMDYSKEALDHFKISLNKFKELGYFTAEQRTMDQNLASIRRRIGLKDPNLLMQNNLPATTNLKKS